MTSDLEQRALKYVEYGTGSQRYALEQGKEGYNFNIDEHTIEPYRIGLNMRLRELGIDTVVAEDFVRGTLPEQQSLQKGFFDETGMINIIMGGQRLDPGLRKGCFYDLYDYPYLQGGLISVNAYIAVLERGSADNSALEILGKLKEHRETICKKIEETCLRLEYSPQNYEILRAEEDAAAIGAFSDAAIYRDMLQDALPPVPAVFMNQVYDRF